MTPPTEPHHLRLRLRRRQTPQSRERQASHPRRLDLCPRHRPGPWRPATAGRKDGGGVAGTLARISGSYGHSRRGDVRAGGMPGPRYLSRALGGASRAGRFAARATRARRCLVCDAGKVEAVAVEDEAVGIGVPGVGEERSQWRIAPSESPRRGSGARGAMLGLFVGNDIRSWQAKK